MAMDRVFLQEGRETEGFAGGDPEKCQGKIFFQYPAFRTPDPARTYKLMSAQTSW